ncbi:hypothetical protein [Spiroplasma diminutum]|uniref:Transmembrane protein n=1 Tax=Spiroplasma diminutum CUAS-1 TaxID=1276221 RepID=S5MJ24_9MOLU|nr:hypothetical protein [Spiroplasma diminutum]AGR41950.1 transmembrane protein [Spiroplasma diminutum CUAS-1]
MFSINGFFLIAMILSFVCLLTIRLYNTFSLSKVIVHEINSADSNISSSKVESIIERFKIYLRAEELNIIYGETENYYRVNQMLNKRKKQITIPKWIMPSVGYELDYILASIWYNTKLIQKDKDIRKLEWIVKWFPIFLNLIYILSFLAAIVFLFLDKDSIIKSNPSKFLIFLFNMPVFELISITTFLLIVILMFFTNSLKSILEEKYEMEIIHFVNNECESYKKDISVARVYSKSFNKLDFKIFRINMKTTNLKFVGPFTLL